jgi:hypothetical protein
MSLSRSGNLDPVLEGVELLFHQKGGSASFGAKMTLSLNGVDLGCMNSITGSTCRAKCSNILHGRNTWAKGSEGGVKTLLPFHWLEKMKYRKVFFQIDRINQSINQSIIECNSVTEMQFFVNSNYFQ